MSKWDDEYRLCPWSITKEAQGEAEEKVLGGFDKFIEGINREEERANAMGQSIFDDMIKTTLADKPGAFKKSGIFSSLGLYRVSRGASEWEQPRAFVVVAESAEVARQTYPDLEHYKDCKWRPTPLEIHGVELTGGAWIDDENFALSQAGKSWVDYRDTSNWPDPKYLEVEYLGRVLTNSFSELTENPDKPLILLISYTGS